MECRIDHILQSHKFVVNANSFWGTTFYYKPASLLLVSQDKRNQDTTFEKTRVEAPTRTRSFLTVLVSSAASSAAKQSPGGRV